MKKIGELAKESGLSRSTLLYYDRIGLLKPALISDSGYRLYSSREVEALRQINIYREAGIALKDIKRLLTDSSSSNGTVIKRRIEEINSELTELRGQQRILIEMLGNKDTGFKELMPDWFNIMKSAGVKAEKMKTWHETFEKSTPEAHLAFLLWLGFTEKEANQIRFLSKNMEDNRIYMEWFYKVFRNMPRQGPGDSNISRQIMEQIRRLLPEKPVVADIGCGTGTATHFLAAEGASKVYAIDNEQSFLDKIAKQSSAESTQDVISCRCESMSDIKLQEGSLDLIWSEGAIFIVGFDTGLKLWKPLLKESGLMVVSELVWFTENPAEELQQYWERVCPSIKSEAEMSAIAEEKGLEILSTVRLGSNAWEDNYYHHMEKQIEILRKEAGANEEAEQVFTELEEEIAVYRKFPDTYGYTFFVMRKK